MAEPAPSNVESLIRGNNWKDASRAIFLEARSANKFEGAIPSGQAKAGFLDDALDTIAGMHANTQPSALVALVADVPSIPPTQAAEIVQRAFDTARKISGKHANYLKSGELARVALYYSRRGAESNARAVFEEALRAAESGITEEGSGGYQQVTFAMLQEPKGCQDWMVLLVAKHLQREGKTANAAFAYRDMAQVAVRLTKNELASELIELGISAAKAIDQASMRKSALEGLASVAVEAGYTKWLPEKSPYTQAIQEARSGNPQKALAIAAGLSQNLYVDHGQQAHRSVFDDAVKRDDLNTAIYFAEHPVRPVSWVQANTWQQVAELQAKRGVQKDALNSYRRAAQAISNSPEATRYFEEIKATVALAASLRQNGFEAEGQKATLDALAMLELIPERRTADRVKAATLIADSLWRYGMHSEAKQQILRAYSVASGYSDKNGMEKARLLSGLGQVTSEFIANASEQRVESKDRKKTK